MNDKNIEKLRYESVSQSRLNSLNELSNLNIVGSDYFMHHHRPPFVIYENMIVNSLNGIKNSRVLDLCCGDGLHSFTALRCGASVIALDYSEASINLAKMRAETLGVNIDFRCADVEKLPFSDSTFDTITCAGSLSYLDHDVFFKEVKRVLKRDGKFIVVDSFNHNIIYRLNRFVHFLRGRRSYMTLKRMPNRRVLEKVEREFSELNVKYYGIFIFLTPFLRLLLKKSSVESIIFDLDQKFSFLKLYSFKIIFTVTKK